jgi:hypothetical protein
MIAERLTDNPILIPSVFIVQKASGMTTNLNMSVTPP